MTEVSYSLNKGHGWLVMVLIALGSRTSCPVALAFLILTFIASAASNCFFLCAASSAAVGTFAGSGPVVDCDDFGSGALVAA